MKCKWCDNEAEHMTAACKRCGWLWIRINRHPEIASRMLSEYYKDKPLTTTESLLRIELETMFSPKADNWILDMFNRLIQTDHQLASRITELEKGCGS